MADSPSHQLGEFIGDFLEATIIRALRPVIDRPGYYLDYKHPRTARNFKHEVTQTDAQGNEHKLDIVIEKNGSDTVLGTPKAFIEVAWRRYTKHSKNKVQEISGAILPIVDRYSEIMPFYAAVLAGEFTENSLQQLNSQGFYVVYFPYIELCNLFDTVRISIRWEENSPDALLARIYNQLSSLSQQTITTLQDSFIQNHLAQFNDLISAINTCLGRRITEVNVLPLHGNALPNTSIEEAVSTIRNYQNNQLLPFNRYVIMVRYSTGETCQWTFSTEAEALYFLQNKLQ